MRLGLVIIAVLMFASVALTVENVEAIGVSPAILYYENMLRGGYAEREVTISNSFNDPVIIGVAAKGEIKDWLDFEGGFSVKQGEPARMKLIIRPPIDIPNGIYSGTIRFTSSSFGTVESQIGSSIQASVEANIRITITDEQILACEIGSVLARSAEVGSPVVFSFSLKNGGNVRVNPSASLDIWDQDQINIVKHFEQVGRVVLPTQRQEIVIQMPTDDLPIGQYWVDFTITECADSYQFLTFDVKEKGSLETSGVLHNILNDVWVTVGDIVPITAVFENTGENQASAKFKGTIELEGRVIDLIESEELLVLPGEKVDFVMFFTPKEDGRHIIKGKVFYGSKRTFESFGVLNVLPRETNTALIVVLIVVLIAAIIIALIVLRRSRKTPYF